MKRLLDQRGIVHAQERAETLSYYGRFKCNNLFSLKKDDPLHRRHGVTQTADPVTCVWCAAGTTYGLYSPVPETEPT